MIILEENQHEWTSSPVTSTGPTSTSIRIRLDIIAVVSLQIAPSSYCYDRDKWKVRCRARRKSVSECNIHWRMNIYGWFVYHNDNIATPFQYAHEASTDIKHTFPFIATFMNIFRPLHLHELMHTFVVALKYCPQFNCVEFPECWRTMAIIVFYIECVLYQMIQILNH